MKFVDIKGNQKVLSISISRPELVPGYEYFYPDGITKGFFEKKTYFVRYNLDRYDYRLYSSVQNALRGRGQENRYFVRDGKIWDYGYVEIILRSDPENENIFKYKDMSELINYLDILESRWGINLNDLVCLETSKIDSLYEHKTLGDKGFRESVL